MKTTLTPAFKMTEDEFTGFYNWSERTSVYFNTKKREAHISVIDSLTDILCMAVTMAAMISCL